MNNDVQLILSSAARRQMNEAGNFIGTLIDGTPTSKKRDLYTEANILRMEAENKLKQAEACNE